MRTMDAVKRITVKIGTNILSRDMGIDLDFLNHIAEQVAELSRKGYEILLVSSGAIGMGAGELGLSERVPTIPMRQACASIGQPLLMQHYKEIFRRKKVLISQILLTREVLDNRLSYLNLRNAIETLLELHVIPVLNENDSVSTAEIGTAFGDNDTLSAYIASKTDSDLLILLTDIDGLYNGNPKSDANAELVPFVPEITDEISSWAGEATGSTFSTGGMRTKLLAAGIASKAGCASIIADGRKENILLRLLAGEEEGTFFAASMRLPSRDRWILHTQPSGIIHVDRGAEEALRNRKSLLPVGVTGVEGVFQRGSVVMINDVAKAVSAFTSEEIRSMVGYHSEDAQQRINGTRKAFIARPEDIVFL